MYFSLKLIHILSSTLLFGTGLGSAFYFWRAHQSTDLKIRYFAARNVVIADWLFTTPAVIIQPVTGFLLLYFLHMPLNTTWVVISLVLYVFVGCCWLPVVWLQIKMRDQLAEALRAQTQLSKKYMTYYKTWLLLGWPAFISVIAIFYLMIFKPS